MSLDGDFGAAPDGYGGEWPPFRTFGDRGSMAGLYVPLPTLRRSPRGLPRTARGRCGLLLLHRGGLSPPTPCRFRRRTGLLDFCTPRNSRVYDLLRGRNRE